MAGASEHGTCALRVDKWLWHARFFKSRSIAAQAIKGGKIRINGRKPSRASAAIRVDDVLTIVRGHHVILVQIQRLGSRRGPAVEATLLYKVLDKSQKTPRP
ncbi:MAG: RNA-binding S4 domain-containing protein [Pseudomonadota bacterium]